MEKIFLDEKEINEIKLEKGFNDDDIEYKSIYFKKIDGKIDDIWFLDGKFKNLRNVNESEKIIPKDEYEKIRKGFKRNILEKVIRDCNIESNVEYITSLEELENFLIESNLKDVYEKELERMKKINSIDSNTLVSVKFEVITSSNLGCFLKLKERVDEEIFRKLKKCGLTEYKFPFDAFNGFGVGYSINKVLELKEVGIYVKID